LKHAATASSRPGWLPIRRAKSRTGSPAEQCSAACEPAHDPFPAAQRGRRIVIIVGYICIGIALVWILIKAYVAYSSAGGTADMSPIFDAALYPPILAAFGLYWVLPSFQIDWGIWIYVLIWLGLTLLVAGLLKVLEELGDRPL
jgi:hypothetical protein